MALLGALAPAVDGTRLTVHVLAAAVWVGGQVTLAGLVPTARRLGEGVPRQLARAFSRLSWPAYGVLLATGVWNVLAADAGQGTAWQAALGVKILAALVSGLAAFWHGRARDARALAIWGATAGVASLVALGLGVFLAG